MGPPQEAFGVLGQNVQDSDYPTQPPMMSFKIFLSQQDDTISDSDAVKKYNEYKEEFKKQQINEFFLQHKEEEWLYWISAFFTYPWNRRIFSRLQC